jgi:Arc/MetJ-type ribon-helix-helix transcriptional regulator
MEQELVTISARIPRKLNADLEEYASSLGYASKTEVLREMLRNELYGSIGAMRGALKGKVILKESMQKWRLAQWNAQLLRAGGDRKKAIEIAKHDEEGAVSGLRLKVRKE